MKVLCTGRVFRPRARATAGAYAAIACVQFACVLCLIPSASAATTRHDLARVKPRGSGPTSSPPLPHVVRVLNSHPRSVHKAFVRSSRSSAAAAERSPCSWPHLSARAWSGRSATRSSKPGRGESRRPTRRSAYRDSRTVERRRRRGDGADLCGGSEPVCDADSASSARLGSSLMDASQSPEWVRRRL